MQTLEDFPPIPYGPRTTITVFTSQLEALRERLGPELSDDDLYSAAAIAVLIYLPRERYYLPRDR